MKRCYRVSERIVTFLMGGQDTDPLLDGIVKVDAPTTSNNDIAHKTVFTNLKKSAIAAEKCAFVQLTGDDRESAQGFVSNLAVSLKRKILTAPVSALHTREEWRLDMLSALLREAALQPAIILLYEEDRAGESVPDSRPLLRLLARKGHVVFYMGTAYLNPGAIDSAIQFIKLPFSVARASERVKYWRNALSDSEQDWNNELIVQAAMRYPLSQGRVQQVVDRLKTQLNGENKDPKLLLTALNKVVSDFEHSSLGDLAHHIVPAFSWNDLVVPKHLSDHLRAFQNSIAHKYMVYETWGAGAKSPRGQGEVALFSGPSGTGKTMAAEVIANELGLDLYRVDLAGVVSKYIGETEKNLKKIFDGANGTNTLLFFDEADSLFGKRTEIKDSHDRYANLEVNYLLQRLEDHEGPVILASNMRKAIDEAFLRRIHFIIEFPKPSETLRQIIWQKKLPPGVPRANDVDLRVLAKNFELSGGDIKNVAIKAAFLAASDGHVLKMKHLLEALRREYKKLGKLMPETSVEIPGTRPVKPSVRRRQKEVGKLGN